jgi:hypothetical protein
MDDTGKRFVRKGKDGGGLRLVSAGDFKAFIFAKVDIGKLDKDFSNGESW